MIEPDLSFGLDLLTSIKSEYLSILKSFDYHSIDKLELARNKFFKSIAAEPVTKVPHLSKMYENAEILILCIKDLISNCNINPIQVQQIADQLILILENKTNFESKDFPNLNAYDISTTINTTIEIYIDEKSKKNDAVLKV